MPTLGHLDLPAADLHLTRARAKVLAREDREFRAELVRLRRDAGLTQKQVADMIGVSQQAINKFERYDADPKQSTLRRYANAVGAIVEHNVIPDLGQSAWVAASRPWESDVALIHSPIRAEFGAMSKTTNADWIESAITQFDFIG